MGAITAVGQSGTCRAIRFVSSLVLSSAAVGTEFSKCTRIHKGLPLPFLLLGSLVGCAGFFPASFFRSLLLLAPSHLRARPS